MTFQHRAAQQHEGPGAEAGAHPRRSTESLLHNHENRTAPHVRALTGVSAGSAQFHVDDTPASPPGPAQSQFSGHRQDRKKGFPSGFPSPPLWRRIWRRKQDSDSSEAERAPKAHSRLPPSSSTYSQGLGPQAECRCYNECQPTTRLTALRA